MNTQLAGVRERAEEVEQWSQLHGMELDVYVREDAMEVMETALWLAGDVLLLLSIIEGAKT